MKLEDIKTGAFLYYTERPHSNYADSLIEIRDIDGVLMAHPICTNFYESGYINETENNWGEDLPVSFSFDKDHWHPTTYTGGNPAEWMAENYPLETPRDHQHVSRSADES